MTARSKVLTWVAMAALVALGATAHAGMHRSPAGAWYGAGLANLPGATPFSVSDIYWADPNNPNRGTVLCTIATGLFPVIVDGQIVSVVRSQPTASGTWVRIDKERIAVTLWRLVTDPQTGAPVGSVKNWGVGTMPSRNQLHVELKSQFYGLDGVPVGTPLEATVTSERVVVEVEE